MGLLSWRTNGTRGAGVAGLERPEPFDVWKVREDFPVLRQQVNGKPLVYLDNAATSQKPRRVIDCLTKFYARDNANIHRGVHLLSERATEAYEEARAKVQRFLNAREPREVIFVRGTTEAINLVAQSYGRQRLAAGDEVVVSLMEHHSNIVPWQILCRQTGALLRVIPMNRSGEIVMEDFGKILGPKTRLVAITHASNAIGTVNPVKEIVQKAHELGAVVLVDGAQAVPHLRIDLQELGCDFYAFSGHKVYGPTGIGVLYGRAELLSEMDPYQGGGDMITRVSFEETVYNEIPYKFEAGTPHIAGAIGLAAAIGYLEELGLEKVAAAEMELLRYGTEKLSEVRGLRLIGLANEKAPILSFVLDGVHPHDIGTVLDAEGIAIRTGHHCAMPLMDWFKLPATARASLAFYNTKEEIDLLVSGIEKVREMFKGGS